MAVRFAVKNGNFSDPTVWDNGAVPLTDDDVYANGFTVTLDTNATVNTLRNDGSAVYLPNEIIPVMTGNSAPNGVASASSTQAGYQPYFAFDQSSSSIWFCSNNTGWLQYQFPSAKTIRRYAFSTSTATNAPKTWTFEGSNDGSTWTVLDTQTNLTLAGNSWNTYAIASPASYTYYRINITLSGGQPLAIPEFNMTESTGTVYGGTAGGTFSLANGVDFTCSANSGVVVGSATAPVTFSLASPNSATLRATLSNGSFAGGRPVLVSGTGTFNLIGNLNTNVVANVTCCVDISAASTVNITGDLTHSTGNLSNQIAVIRAYGSGVLNITGNIFHNVLANAVNSFTINGATTAGATSTVNITGNITTTNNTGAGQALFIASGNVTVNGNVTAGGVTAIATSAGNTTVNGNVSAGAAGGNGINTSTTGTVTVIGTVTASTTNVGIFSSSTALITCTGNLVNNSNGMMAVNAQRINISGAATQTWNMFRAGGVARNLLTPDQIVVSGTFPAVSDVRSGVTYGMGTYTGTCAMPDYLSVTLGVPVDAGVGKAYTPDNIADLVWNKLTSTLTVSGSAGERVKNIATVHTTGAQIAAMRR